MGTVFLLALVVSLILLVVGIILLSYWLPKKLGYKKIGIVLSSILTLGLFIFVLESFVFKDYLFFKSDVKEFLSDNDISLKDEFIIEYNDTDEILDAYQNFGLEISPSDKMRIIETIKSSKNFGEKNFTANQADNSISTINYEDDQAFIRKSRRKFGPGEISIISIVEINKTKNTLTFYKYIP